MKIDFYVSALTRWNSKITHYKRDFIIEKQSPLEGFYDLLAECPSNLSWLAEILEVRKGELFELHRREGGTKDICWIS